MKSNKTAAVKRPVKRTTKSIKTTSSNESDSISTSQRGTSNPFKIKVAVSTQLMGKQSSNISKLLIDKLYRPTTQMIGYDQPFDGLQQKYGYIHKKSYVKAKKELARHFLLNNIAIIRYNLNNISNLKDIIKNICVSETDCSNDKFESVWATFNKKLISDNSIDEFIDDILNNSKIDSNFKKIIGNIKSGTGEMNPLNFENIKYYRNLYYNLSKLIQDEFDIQIGFYDTFLSTQIFHESEKGIKPIILHPTDIHKKIYLVYIHVDLLDVDTGPINIIANPIKYIDITTEDIDKFVTLSNKLNSQLISEYVFDFDKKTSSTKSISSTTVSESSSIIKIHFNPMDCATDLPVIQINDKGSFLLGYRKDNSYRNLYENNKDRLIIKGEINLDTDQDIGTEAITGRVYWCDL